MGILVPYLLAFFNLVYYRHFMEKHLKFKKCPKHCDWVEYHGAKLTSYYNHDNSNFHYWWSYHFDNELIEVQEEYLMYDIIGLIGTIGGTLGLFVGFSFLDLSSTFMHFFASWINHD